MITLPTLDLAPPDGRNPLVFCWGVSSFFGWGVCGLNLMLALADHPDFVPLCGVGFGPEDVVLDPLREARITQLGTRSRVLWDALERVAGPAAIVRAPVLAALDGTLLPTDAIHGKHLLGSPLIGLPVIEQARITLEARRAADQYALMIAASSWNERILRANGIEATLVPQGVDTSLFHPAPRAGTIGDRFVVFSGGKLEFRKGQDLVLAAFRAFRQRHQEAVLLTAWHSPWSEFAATAAGHPGITVPTLAADGTPDIVGWAVANGIPAEAVIAIGPTPNIAMPHVMREADVALFPNRAEGGTNLVAMECMACGVPTILSGNTGHLDLLQTEGVALRLDRQHKVRRDGIDTTDWGESDVEEIVETLESVWRDRDVAASTGTRAAAFMARLSWTRHAARLIRAIAPLLP